MPAQSVVTKSYAKPQAAWLREFYDAEAIKAGGVAAEAADASKVVRAEVNEMCPACSHPRMEYYALHLRGADEGQTIFWEVRVGRGGFLLEERRRSVRAEGGGADDCHGWRAWP